MRNKKKVDNEKYFNNEKILTLSQALKSEFNDALDTDTWYLDNWSTIDIATL